MKSTILVCSSISFFVFLFSCFVLTGVRIAAQRKLGHELGIPAEDIPLDSFLQLSILRYKARSNERFLENEGLFLFHFSFFSPLTFLFLV